MVLEWPFVSADVLAAAYDPADPALTAPRRLRAQRFISDGILRAPHREGRLRGRTVVYCALNIDAVEAARDGDVDKARELAAAAAEIEANPNVRELARSLDEAVDALSAKERETAIWVATMMRQARGRWGVESDPVVGRVTWLGPRSVRLATASEEFELPRQALRAHDLDRSGAAVTVYLSVFKTGWSAFTVRPALVLPEAESDEPRAYDPFAMFGELRTRIGSGDIIENREDRAPRVVVAPIAIDRR
jgi:hypothetical protein